MFLPYYGVEVIGATPSSMSMKESVAPCSTI